MSLYLLSAINPTKRVINLLHRIFAKFFWSGNRGERRKHWVAWEDICFPKKEGGVGFRTLHGVTKALFSKLWWRFRVSTDSLWITYMWNKYCKKQHPVIAGARGASHVWKKIMEMRKEVEQEIGWQIKSGNSSFWYDNWTRKGALYLTNEEDIEVQMCINNGEWDKEKLCELVSEEVVVQIIKNIKLNVRQDEVGQPWWMLNTSGIFSVKSAFEIVRDRKPQQDWLENIWLQEIPFKIIFFPIEGRKWENCNGGQSKKYEGIASFKMLLL
ncbi:uncharacterized mitochondrial protein AtMg00310-like [Solanum verrucosum]|uniref:uncharacterized mitochondrial protein AtMg00310-like n=1 Tax=Solanum verrucosum TaxID=315347 RepID=UPI0020D1E771|nr:uncharacterized mitochondrial protein AtMg00310-like [Solanum verrucosum]